MFPRAIFFSRELLNPYFYESINGTSYCFPVNNILGGEGHSTRCGELFLRSLVGQKVEGEKKKEKIVPSRSLSSNALGQQAPSSVARMISRGGIGRPAGGTAEQFLFKITIRNFLIPHFFGGH